jgi:dihydroorotate dehydrogenase electron transfer subunit
MTGSPTAPVHVAGELLAARTVGAYRELSLVAPGVGVRARPGAFLALSVGAGHLALRAFWIRRVAAMGGHPAVVEVVVEPRGTGTRALAALQPGSPVAVTGPLGRPFALPRARARCLLVGEGYAAAALTMLAERLRERGCGVRLLLGGADDSHVLGALEARRAVGRVDVVGGDLSAAVAPAVAEAEVVYAAGTPAVLLSCARAADAAGITCQVALERPVTCATGLCQGCPVPVLGDDGRSHLVRDCADGPVFRADRVDWDVLA